MKPEPEKNVCRIEKQVLADGLVHDVPIPMPCGRCGKPACYGVNGRWFCTECWLRPKQETD